MKKVILSNVAILLVLFVIIITISTVNADEIILKPSLGIGFQDEWPYEEDHTLNISNLDDNWAPPTTLVEFDYYATGLDSRFWDALTIKFDTGMYDPSEYTAILRFYAQKGDYWNTSWHHYIILEGYMNSTYEDTDYGQEPVISDPTVHSIGDTDGDWFEETLPSSYWTKGSFWVTLRMWDVRIDTVEILLERKVASPVSVTRDLPDAVSPGEEFNVSLNQSGFYFTGSVTETLPEGFSYRGVLSGGKLFEYDEMTNKLTMDFQGGATTLIIQD